MKGPSIARSCVALAALALFALIPASAQAGRTVYVTNGDSPATGLAAFSAVDGPLVPVPGTPVPTGEDSNAVIVSPNARNVYVADTGDDTVTAYSVNAAGVPTKIASAPAGNQPTGLAMTPDGRFLLATNRDSTDTDPSVSVFSVGPNGVLTPLGAAVDVGVFDPRGVVVTPDGAFVYVIGRRGPTGGGAANADTAIAMLSINAGGTLASQPGSPLLIANQVAGFGLSTSPDGKRLYAAHSNNKRIYAFDINASSGALSAVAGSPFATTGMSPQELYVTPDGGSLYVAEVFGKAVEGFDITPATGALTQIPGTPVTVAGQSDSLAITPDGDSLYQSILSNPGQVEGFGIGATGGLSRFDGSPYPSGGVFPSFFSVAVTPTQTPQPTFTTSGVKGSREVKFDASGTTVRGGEAATYTWDLGDGSAPLTFDSPQFQRTYTADGTYMVKLTVHNDCDPNAVFTGGVASIGNAVYCNGSPTAETTRKVVVDSAVDGSVKAKPQQRQGGSKLIVKAKVKAGERLRADINGKAKGVKLKPAVAIVGAGKTRKLELKAVRKEEGKKLLEKLAAGKQVTAKLEARLTDRAGNQTKSTLEVELKR